MDDLPLLLNFSDWLNITKLLNKKHSHMHPTYAYMYVPTHAYAYEPRHTRTHTIPEHRRTHTRHPQTYVYVDVTGKYAYAYASRTYAYAHALSVRQSSKPIRRRSAPPVMNFLVPFVNPFLVFVVFLPINLIRREWQEFLSSHHGWLVTESVGKMGSFWFFFPP
jgi:hypothetical protein